MKIYPAFIAIIFLSFSAPLGYAQDDGHLDKPIGGGGTEKSIGAKRTDSTKMPRSTKEVYRAQYLDITSKPPTITGARYDLLATCPPAIINCPDLMDKGGSTQQCPDYCRATRNPEILTFQVGTNKVTSNPIDPVCPVGYSQVDQYNMQNEATYNANPAMLTPITGMAQYDDYKKAGYTCQPQGNVRTSAEYCQGTFSDGQITDQVNTGGGKVVQIINSYYNRCYVDFFGCGSSTSFGCGAGTNPLWIYRYREIGCTPPAGLYLTGKMVPVSIVCARVKTTWKPISN